MSEPAPASPDSMSYTEPGDLAAIRVFVCAKALALGLPTGRVDLLTLASPS